MATPEVLTRFVLTGEGTCERCGQEPAKISTLESELVGTRCMTDKEKAADTATEKRLHKDWH